MINREPQFYLGRTWSSEEKEDNYAVFLGRRGKSVITTPSILADLAIIDPIVTISLPPSPTAFTGMDALSHAIEGIMS